MPRAAAGAPASPRASLHSLRHRAARRPAHPRPRRRRAGLRPSARPDRAASGCGGRWRPAPRPAAGPRSRSPAAPNPATRRGRRGGRPPAAPGPPAAGRPGRRSAHGHRPRWWRAARRGRRPACGRGRHSRYPRTATGRCGRPRPGCRPCRRAPPPAAAHPPRRPGAAPGGEAGQPGQHPPAAGVMQIKAEDAVPGPAGEARRRHPPAIRAERHGIELAILGEADRRADHQALGAFRQVPQPQRLVVRDAGQDLPGGIHRQPGDRGGMGAGLDPQEGLLRRLAAGLLRRGRGGGQQPEGEQPASDAAQGHQLASSKPWPCVARSALATLSEKLSRLAMLDAASSRKLPSPAGRAGGAAGRRVGKLAAGA